MTLFVDTNILLDIRHVLAMRHHDFEDAVQYQLALANRCDCIISNDQGFYLGDIEVLTSKSFVKRYLQAAHVQAQHSD